jgi:hypothetical protein
VLDISEAARGTLLNHTRGRVGSYRNATHPCLRGDSEHQQPELKLSSFATALYLIVDIVLALATCNRHSKVLEFDLAGSSHFAANDEIDRGSYCSAERNCV